MWDPCISATVSVMSLRVQISDGWKCFLHFSIKSSDKLGLVTPPSLSTRSLWSGPLWVSWWASRFSSSSCRCHRIHYSCSYHLFNYSTVDSLFTNFIEPQDTFQWCCVHGERPDPPAAHPVLAQMVWDPCISAISL